MTTRTTVPALLAALLLFAQVPAAVAADDPDEDEPEQKVDAPWSLALGTQVDQLSTRGFTGELGRDLTPNTTLRFAADSTSYASNAATAQAGFNSNGIELGATHDFERFSIAGAVARWQDTDLVTAKELKLGGDFHFDPWSVGLRTGYRRAKFDPFHTQISVTLKDGTVVDANTTSRCTLDNTALGLDGRFEGDVWGFYATAMQYQYKDAKCGVTANGKNVLSKADRQQLRDLSAGILDRLSGVATRRIGRQETLLDSSLDSGVSWKHDDLTVSLDYSHQKDFFIGAASNTYSVTGTADLGDHTGVDCTLGVTRGGNVTSGGFVGFALRAKF
jgi:hypothetical protein